MLCIFKILTFFSILHSTLGYPEDQCLTEFGFLPSPQARGPSTYIYFYSGIEAQGGSSRYIFPNLTVSCYSKIDQILLFQGLPYACVKARTQYEFELWSPSRTGMNEYELVYRELLIYRQDELSVQIPLQPNSNLLMAPGDIIGFRNSTLNFYNMGATGAPSESVTLTYTGSIEKQHTCHDYSHITLGSEVTILGSLSPYFNFTLTPYSPNASEFSVQFDGKESTVSTIRVYHRGIYRPICHQYWHIDTADTLCQRANFSHAVIAATGYALSSEDHPDVDVSSFYWLDYLYCGRFKVDPSLCLRSSWECIRDCNSVNQTAAAACAREEGRTRFVLEEVQLSDRVKPVTTQDRLSRFSDEFNDHRLPIVQVYYNGYWHELSTDNLTTSDTHRTAEVICRSNGFTSVYLLAKLERESSSNFNTFLKCTGSESNTSCFVHQQKSSNNSSILLVLACSYSEGNLSLYNNRSHDPTEGEVLFAASNQTSNKLAFVCTESWTAIESSVACKQIGFPTLFNYSLISTSSSSESQYSYYKPIANFTVIQANFSCLGDESSVKECKIIQNPQSNSPYSMCEESIVNLKCATHEQILTKETQCYDYKEILGGDYNYEFGRSNNSTCYFLFDLIAASSKTNSNNNDSDSSNVYVKLLDFGRTVSIFGSFIKLTFPGIKSRRSLQDSGLESEPCLVLYSDSNGTPVSVAGITNRASNIYTTLYHIERSENLKLTGNYTNLTNSLKVSSLSLVCHQPDVEISSAYVISSETELLTNATYPQILMNKTALVEIDNAFQSLLVPPTVIPSTGNSSSPTNTTLQPAGNELMVILLTTGGVVGILLLIVSSFLCLLSVVRWHYKREILNLQIQSKTVVSSVYGGIGDNEFVNTALDSNYVQQNVYYYKLKHQSNACALFIESTKSMRHAIRRVSIAPKFGLNMPQVDYVLANAEKNCHLQDQWHIERDQLVYMRELGLGHYGKVQLMETKKLYGCEKLPVAVKTLSTQDPVHTEQFMREIDLMMSLRNEYIVSLLGFCSPSRDATPLMVLEYLEYGDLKSLIVAYQDTPTGRENELNILHLVSMAANIASAMVYLASKHLVHRDIAARNCLVGRQLVCKLADFGLALMTDGSDSSILPRSRTTVPLKWTAPETFISGCFSFKSDIWSYGVFLWEVFTYGCEPLDDFTKDELIFAINDGTLVLPHIPDAPVFCNDLVQMCCFFNPEQRPKVTDIQDILEGVMYQIESESTASYSESSNLVETIV